jgi:hypothetical protein
MEGKESHDEYGHEFFLISAFWFLTEIKMQIMNTRKLSFLMFPIPKIDVNIFSSSSFNFSLVIVMRAEEKNGLHCSLLTDKGWEMAGRESDMTIITFYPRVS